MSLVAIGDEVAASGAWGVEDRDRAVEVSLEALTDAVRAVIAAGDLSTVSQLDNSAQERRDDVLDVSCFVCAFGVFIRSIVRHGTARVGLYGA